MSAALDRPRSVLCVPASEERMAAKALDSAADRVLLDLEDAVEASRKDAARAFLVELLGGLDEAHRARVSVRINAAGTGWSHKDLAAIASAPGLPRSLVLPKSGRRSVIYAEQLLRDIDAAQGRFERPREPFLELLIENADGLAYVRGGFRAEPRVGSLVIGYADLGASIGRPGTTALETWLPAQHEIVTAARVWNIAAMDGPHLGTPVDQSFKAAVQRAYALGFDGKWVIHPQQIEYVNEAFTPTADQLTWAREVLAALDQAAAADKRGEVQFEGQMLDEAVALTARRLLDRAGVAQ